MQQIRREFEPEFQKNFGNLLVGQMILFNKVLDEVATKGSEVAEDLERFNEAMVAVRKKMMAEAPEFIRIYEELRYYGQSFTTRYRADVRCQSSVFLSASLCRACVCVTSSVVSQWAQCCFPVEISEFNCPGGSSAHRVRGVEKTSHAID
jgi:hypothetical protein